MLDQRPLPVTQPLALTSSEAWDSWDFDVFLSYRRIDGARAAKWIRRFLQDYKLPTAIASALQGRGERDGSKESKNRGLRVYSDTAYERANEDFWARNIEPALCRSRYLLVVVTPATLLRRTDGRQNWVEREIEAFQKLPQGNNILVALEGGQIDGPLPGALRQNFPNIHIIDLTADGWLKPIWFRTPSLRWRALGLLAPLYNIPDILMPDLYREEERRKRRNAWTAASVAAGLLLLVSALALALFFQSEAATSAKVDAEQQRDIATTNEQKAETQKNLAQAERKEAQAQRDNANRQRALADLQARIANSRRLAMAARLNLEKRLDLASLLSVEAAKLSDTYEARSALLFSLQERPKILTYLHHPRSLFDVAFSPDGKLIATAGQNGVIRLWDTASAQHIGDDLQAGHDPVKEVVFGDGGKLLASANMDGTIRLWDVGRRRQLYQPLKTRGHGLAFSPDGKMLSAAADDCTIWLWDVASGLASGQPLKGHAQSVGSLDNNVSVVAFSPDGEKLASLGGDAIRLWNIASRQPIGELLGQNRASSIESMAFSRDWKQLVTSNFRSRTLQLWNVATGDPIGEPIAKDGPDSPGSVDFSPDGKMLVSGGMDRKVRLWDVATGDAIDSPLVGHIDAVSRVRFSPDGKLLASASYDSTVALWDVKGQRLPRETLEGSNAGTSSVIFSPDGKLLATARQGIVQFWDVATRQRLPKYLSAAALPHIVHEGVAGEAINDCILIQPNVIAFSPDGKALAWADCSATLRLWNLASVPSLSQVLSSPESGPKFRYSWTAVAFSKDGKRLAAAGKDRVIWLWDDPGWKHPVDLLSGPNGPVTMNSIAFSPNGKLLAASGHGGYVGLWDVQSHRELKGFSMGAYNVAVVTFSPDGTLLATGADQRIILWDVASRSIRGSLDAAHFVYSAAFSPDGKWLAEGGMDDTIRIWDVERRQPLAESIQLDPGRRSVNPTTLYAAVSFSPDGTSLAAGGEDRVQLWDLKLSTWNALLCALANRNFTLPEWQQFIGQDVPYQRTCPALPEGDGVRLQSRKMVSGQLR